jgi:hypothetical protein
VSALFALVGVPHTGRLAARPSVTFRFGPLWRLGLQVRLRFGLGRERRDEAGVVSRKIQRAGRPY